MHCLLLKGTALLLQSITSVFFACAVITGMHRVQVMDLEELANAAVYGSAHSPEALLGARRPQAAASPQHLGAAHAGHGHASRHCDLFLQHAFAGAHSPGALVA